MIALYKGISPMSRAIRWLNWSPYSHAAWVDIELGGIIEAWPGGGVRQGITVATNHTPGTVVDLFSVDSETREQRTAIRTFLLGEIGKPYDWRGIVHFLSRRPENPRDQDRWFCSELVFRAYFLAGLPLLKRIHAWQVFPGMLAYSPMLTFLKTVTTERARELGTWAPAAPLCPMARMPGDPKGDQ